MKENLILRVPEDSPPTQSLCEVRKRDAIVLDLPPRQEDQALNRVQTPLLGLVFDFRVDGFGQVVEIAHRGEKGADRAPIA
jgi:hypothetical protein